MRIFYTIVIGLNKSKTNYLPTVLQIDLILQTELIKQKNQMAERKVADIINFENVKHHRQILRSQIDPKLIDDIEIDRNPSTNYMNAYKNLYHDELQRTVQMQDVKKQKQKQNGDEDRFLYTVGMRQERPLMIDQTNMSASQLSKYGQRYVDYDEEKISKAQDHVKRNYDGGQAFYKAHDQHLEKKQNESLVTNQAIGNQLQYKQYVKYKELQKKTEQNQAFKQLKYNQYLQDQDKLQKQKAGQKAFRNEIVVQMQQQRERKQRKTNFQYQNMARHNPITNPIEYHIDNPYILKEIQNRNAFKSQSVHNQNFRH